MFPPLCYPYLLYWPPRYWKIEYKKKTDLENLSFFFKGFLIFALHCVRNSQVSFIWKKDCVEQEFQNLAWIWVPFFVTFLVYLQIRERFKRKVSTVFPSATNGNSTKKNSHVNMSDFAMWRQLNYSLTMNLNWKITHVNVNQNKRVFRE